MSTLRKLLNKKGFTLIELIVVIAILGILAAIAIPRLTGFQGKAKISADKATYETITKSIAAAVANDEVGDGTVIMTTAADTGVVSFAGDADFVTGDAMDLFDSAPVFKLPANMDIDATWTIDTEGKITPPGIDTESGVVTAD